MSASSAGADDIEHPCQPVTVNSHSSCVWATTGHAGSSRSLQFTFFDPANLGWWQENVSVSALDAPGVNDSPLPGVVSSLSAWVIDPTANSVAYIQPVVYQNSGYPVELLSPSPTVLTTTGWTQLNPFIFQVPADAQFTRCPLSQLTLRAGVITHSVTQNWDDIMLYALGTGYRMDGEGRMAEIRTPDGARVKIGRDRFGRVSSLADPVGRVTYMFYDSLDRLTQIQDGNGNSVYFTYDPNSNLSSFQDGDTNLTQYAYDVLDRLHTITYPDTTTEIFGYDAGSRLTGYTDNQSRARTLTYDADNRLTQINYSDSTILKMGYDPIGNVALVTERNGDTLVMTYDKLNRVVSVQRFLSGANVPAWLQNNLYDGNSNRTALQAEPPSTEAVYGTAVYGTGTYVGSTTFWQVSGSGYNSHDLPPGFLDRNSNLTSFLYDIEDRRTQVTYPFPTAHPVQTSAAYDIMGRLISLNTITNTTTLLALAYGYDLSSSRSWQTSATDTFEYAIDGASQLVSANLNRFIEDRPGQFQAGTLDRVKVDATTGTVHVLEFGDTFSGSNIDTDRWRLTMLENYGGYNRPAEVFVGGEIRQYNGLSMSYPRGYCNLRYADLYPPAISAPALTDNFGVNYYAVFNMVAEHREILHGDFDIQVNFSEVFNDYVVNTVVLARLNVQTTQVEIPAPSGGWQVYCGRTPNPALPNSYQSYDTTTGTTTNVTTDDTSGVLRITRVGTTISCCHGGLGTPDYTSTNTLFSADCYVSLQLYCNGGYGSGTFTNFQSNSSKPPTYTQSTPVPNYVSTVYDTAQTGTVTWGKFNFTGTVPTGTNLQFQVATSSSALGPFTFLGPDGTAATYFTTSGTALHTGTTGRYACYKAYLTPNAAGTSTPSFSAVSISYSLSGSNTSAQYTYSIDSSGNITQANVTTDVGTSTSVRNNSGWSSTDKINNLNQIKRNDVTPAGGGTTTFRYTWNADGTLATKTDGTNNWVYNWSADGDQRLLSVVLNGTTLSAFTYDSRGRMLTKTVSGVTTSFEWDGQICIRETTSGSQTRYYAPWGELLTFERGGVTYQVISDALGSVRLVTDNTGAVVARLDYDPYGNLLSTSTDSVPGGMPYRYVGALGCRWDAATGLIYMHQRWYDPSLQRFISRDPMGIGLGKTELGFAGTPHSSNLYAYVSDNPTNYVDFTGMITQDGPIPGMPHQTPPPKPPKNTTPSPQPSPIPIQFPSKSSRWPCVIQCLKDHMALDAEWGLGLGIGGTFVVRVITNYTNSTGISETLVGLTGAEAAAGIAAAFAVIELIQLIDCWFDCAPCDS